MKKTSITTLRGETVQVSIADLVLGDNRDLSEAKVEAMRGSLRRFKQIADITINGNNKVLCGRHRVEAAKREGWRTIRAVRRDDLDEVNETVLQIHENTMRAELTFRQKMKYCQWISENLATPVGRPKTSGLDNHTAADVNISLNLEKFTKPSASVGKLAVAHGIWGSEASYDQARAIEKYCIPEVVDALDSGIISTYRAYKFSSVSVTRQSSLITRIKEQRAVELGKKPGPRPASPAQKKLPVAEAADTYALPTTPEDKYPVIHIAPDWNQTATLKKICRLPVGSFMTYDAAVFLDCPMRKLDEARQALESWKLYFKGVIVIGWKNYKGPLLDYVSQEPLYIVIGQGDRNEAIEFDGNKRIAPIHVADDPSSYAVKLLTDYFGVYMRTCMLDMTSTVPVAGWDVLELKFRRHKKHGG